MDSFQWMDVDECDPPKEELFEAVFKNDLESVSSLLQSGEIDVNKQNSLQKSCLYIAIENENIPMVKLLLDNGADINQSSFSNKFSRYESPLVTSVRLENDELIDLLLEKECTVDGHSVNGKDEKSALQWAASYGNIQLANTLLSRGADINWIGPFFNTALHYATIVDKPDMALWLLEHGAEIVINADGRSPLHIASVRGNIAIVKHLLKFKCEVDIKDNYKYSPFSLACARGHKEIVKYLLKNSPPNSHFDLDDGLHKAAESGHCDLMALLLAEGANPNALNNIGESPLSTAARNGQKGPVKLLLESKSVVNVVDSRGFTPLQLSLLREQVPVSILLVQHGAVVHSLDKNIESPLHLAVSTSNPILVKCILQAGCCLHREPWFTDKEAFRKLQEMEFLCPGPLRFRRESEHQKETWKWIIDQIKQPLQLCQMTRVVIRNHLIVVSNGISIMPLIEKLPVPQTLKKYIALEDVLEQ